MKLKSLTIALAAFSLLPTLAPASAQSWAWAVYHNGKGAIWVANQTTPPDPNVWKRMDSHAFLSQSQAQSRACLLVTKGDLFNRKYSSQQISMGAWGCPS